MGQKALPVVLLVGGVLVFLVCLAADSLGIGGAPGIGWKQITGAAVGVVIAACGMVLLRRR
jgi:hypothetical protein